MQFLFLIKKKIHIAIWFMQKTAGDFKRKVILSTGEICCLNWIKAPSPVSFCVTLENVLVAAKLSVPSVFHGFFRSTVEDLYNREYDLGHTTLKVDILDTAGDMQFPAMRRLCIATAHAFLLVYAVTSAPSFECIKQCFEEVREQRADYQEIPIVVAGNKLDLTSTHREVRIEDVSEWVYCELPKLR